MRDEQRPHEKLFRRLIRGHAGRRLLQDEDLAQLSKIEKLLVARMQASDTDEDVRDQAAHLLADYGTQIDARRVKALARDESWIVRSTATEAICRSLGKRGKSILVAMLEDKNGVVRRDAALAIADLRLTECMPILESKLASEKDQQARAGFLWTLIDFGHREHFNSLIEIGRSQEDNADLFVWNNLKHIIDDPALTEENLLAVRQLIADTQTNGPATGIKRMLDEFEPYLNEKFPPHRSLSGNGLGTTPKQKRAGSPEKESRPSS